MSDISKEEVLEKGIPLDEVKVTEVELLPGQGALIVYQDGVTMVLPEEDNESKHVPQHVLFLMGVYFRSADPAFIELMVRSALDAIANTKLDD